MFFVNNIFGFIVDANLLIKLNDTKAILQNYAQNEMLGVIAGDEDYSSSGISVSRISRYSSQLASFSA